jgi:zinc protease
MRTSKTGSVFRQLTLAVALAAATTASAAEPRHYTTSKLDTGLELVTMESHKVPLVTVVLAVKAGGMTETPDITGLTHLWEHMFFKGNARLPNQEAFNKRIRQLGIVYNGDTSAEKVRYYFTLPSAFLDEGMQFMADAIATPLLEQSEMEKERRVVLDEYDRSAAQPSFDLRNLSRVLIYGPQNNRRDPLGLRPTIENATRDQLLRIKREVFVPSNSALLVSGDVTPAQVEAAAKKHFSTWKDPVGWKPITPPAFPPFPATQSYVMTRANARNASVQITFNGPKARTEQADSFAADVLVNLLDHQAGKFYAKFVDSGLAHAAGVGYFTQSQAGEIDLWGQSDPKNAVKLRDALLAEIPEWTKPDYFTDAQLEDIRRKLLIDHKRQLVQPSEYVKTLAFWWAVTGFDYYDGYLDNLRKISLADVRAFVGKYLVGKPHLDAILMSPEDAKTVGLKDTAQPTVDKLLGMYKRTKAAAGTATKPKG